MTRAEPARRRGWRSATATVPARWIPNAVPVRNEAATHTWSGASLDIVKLFARGISAPAVDLVLLMRDLLAGAQALPVESAPLHFASFAELRD